MVNYTFSFFLNTLVHFMLLFLSPLFSFGQTGPGGVGITDGSSGLSMWLDANSISGITNNTSMAGVWADQSGNGNDAIIGTAPQYKSAGFGNGQPSLFFNNSDYMRVLSDSEVLPTGELSVFVAANFETGSTDWASIISSYSTDAANDGWALEREAGTNKMRFYIEDYYNANKRCDHSMTYNQDEVWSMVFNTTLNKVSTYLSESSCNFNANFNGPINYNTGGNEDLLIGAGVNNGGPAYFLQGDIGEVIIYDVAVNDAQRIIISNYLAAKYDISIVTNDLYNEDNVSSGNYDHDVAGIGRTDASNIHDDSQGTGIVRMLNPTSLGNDKFMIWGHDNGVQQNIETTDIPVGVGARFDRVWRVSEVRTNGAGTNVGAVDMRWDLSSFGSVTASNLRLLIDTDNDGLFIDETPISGATAIGGDVFQFSSVPGGVTGIRNNRRFTLATISTNTLPIDLLNFNATPTGNGFVKLDWQTVSEINNDYFTIERSTNGIDWEELTRVEGAGNSNLLLNYFSIDELPYKGLSYYRLRQTDFDGKFSYSNVVFMNNKTANSISIYPNPAQNQIEVSGNRDELESFQVYTIQGKNATKLTSIIEWTDNKLIMDISKLNSGIYFLKTKTTVNKIHKK
jgi:hypothetical protein